MRRAAGITAGQDRLEGEASVRVGQLMRAEGEATLVISPLGVGVPEIDDNVRDGTAIRRQHTAE